MNVNKYWWNPKLEPVSISISILIIHFILKEILSRFDIISAIFSAGEHTPFWMISCIGIFIITRLALFLLVPILISWKIIDISFKNS